jgi:hypothetical protein
MGDFLYICFMEITQDNFVLYMHSRKKDGRIFYIGYGCPERAYDFSNRGDWWKGVYKKNGVVVTILQKDLSSDKAKELEIKMIAFYGRQKPSPHNPNYGCLINLTDGGDGGTGRVWTEEEREYHRSLWTDEKREKQRLINLGENNAMYGKSIFDVWYEKYDEEVVQSMIAEYLEQKRLYMLENNPHNDPEVRIKIGKSLKNKPKSETHRKNLSISKTGTTRTEEQKQHQSVLSTGSKNANSKLTEEDVIWIRKNYIPRHKVYGMGKLAKRFNVSFGSIDLIVRNITWTHIL